MNLVIHTDGGARGNPGPAAVGVVIEQGEASVVSHQSSDTKSLKAEDGKLKTVIEFGKKIGETTNNVAEYTAVIEALKEVKRLSAQAGQDSSVRQTLDEEEKIQINFFLDSTLVVNQLNGLFKVKEPHLRQLLMGVRALEGEVGGVILYHAIPREQNTRADALVNVALDS